MIEYIKNHILPHYNTFDQAHDMRHAEAVISRSLELAKSLNDPTINLDIVYAVAAYHDIGMIKGRENHAKYSHDYVLQDENLKQFFDSNEILIISEACEDHSASSGHTPRTIYGKIVSDSDKDNDLKTSLMRLWDFSIDHFPKLTFDDRILDIQKQIKLRFGEGGKVRFYLPYTRNQEYLKTMTQLSTDTVALRNKYKEYLSINDQ